MQPRELNEQEGSARKGEKQTDGNKGGCGGRVKKGKEDERWTGMEIKIRE